MLPTELPTRPEDLTLAALNRVIADHRPEAVLSDFTITESHTLGCGSASSAGRIVIEPTYADPSVKGLPRHIIVKVAKSYPGQEIDVDKGESGSGQLYSNEVNVYSRLRPADFMESAQTLGGAFDPATNTFMLLLEDLRDRDVVFATMKIPTSIHRMRSLIQQLAALHARFWNSPEFEGGALAWAESHTRGAIHDLFSSERVAAFVDHQVAVEQYKEEMMQRLGSSPREMFDQFQRVQAHQARGCFTLCHGDMHIGNSYILPDDSAGILDWQLSCKGSGLHDISYVMSTGLSVADRRTHERELLAYYRDQLVAKGVGDVPSFDELWLEYRLAMAWNVYIGWLVTPTLNYGWDVSVMAHLRTMTAYEDLETRKAIEAISL